MVGIATMKSQRVLSEEKAMDRNMNERGEGP